MQASLLGLPGDLADSSDQRNPRDWRIGGKPCLPTTVSLPPLTCAVCHTHLCLLAQVSDSGDGRIYLVFGCKQAGCGRKQESWKAFCWQSQSSGNLCHSTAGTQQSPAGRTEGLQDQSSQAIQTHVSSRTAATDFAKEGQPGSGSWGVEDPQEWGPPFAGLSIADPGAPQGGISQENLQPRKIEADLPWLKSSEGVATTNDVKSKEFGVDSEQQNGWNKGDATDDDDGFGDLLSQLDTAMNLATESSDKKHNKKHNQPANMSGRDLFSTSNAQSWQISSPHPEQAVSKDVDSSARASSSTADTRKQDHNAQVQLPKDDTSALPEFYMYTLRDGSGSSAATSREENQHILELIRAYEAGGNVLPEQGTGHKGSGEEIWAGERYEPSAVQGVDAGFLKFAKNLRRNPDQCIRLRGSLVWPEKTPPSQISCARCSQPMTFVLQLMPPLMACLDETAHWLGLDTSAVPLHDWEWATLAVFDCQSCSAGQSAGPTECAILIANE